LIAKEQYKPIATQNTRELKMTIQNRLAGIAEGLYFLKNQYDRDLVRISKPGPTKGGGS
jgi:hypothetical protein